MFIIELVGNYYQFFVLIIITVNVMGEHKVYITGASGLLGRALYQKFINEDWSVYGIALSRARENLHKVDITNAEDLTKSIEEFKPDIIIHAAAQRFPDLVDKNPEAAKKLNIEATKNLCDVGKKYNIPVLYISTDYVFDGANSPYSVNDKPNPLNLYGETKLRGEEETLRANPQNMCLRIPVLYGPVESLNESAITSLFSVLKHSDVKVNVSDYEVRNPSHVDDIAHVCFKLSNAKIENKIPSIHGIYHWCGDEVFTKYQMLAVMSNVFHLRMDHVLPVKHAGNSGVPRPYDTRLETSRIDDLGFGKHTPFEMGIRQALEKWA